MEACRVYKNWHRDLPDAVPGGFEWFGPLSAESQANVEALIQQNDDPTHNLEESWLKLPALHLSEGSGKKFYFKQVVKDLHGQDF